MTVTKPEALRRVVVAAPIALLAGGLAVAVLIAVFVFSRHEIVRSLLADLALLLVLIAFDEQSLAGGSVHSILRRRLPELVRSHGLGDSHRGWLRRQGRMLKALRDDRARSEPELARPALRYRVAVWTARVVLIVGLIAVFLRGS